MWHPSVSYPTHAALDISYWFIPLLIHIPIGRLQCHAIQSDLMSQKPLCKLLVYSLGKQHDKSHASPAYFCKCKPWLFIMEIVQNLPIQIPEPPCFVNFPRHLKYIPPWIWGFTVFGLNKIPEATTFKCSFLVRCMQLLQQCSIWSDEFKTFPSVVDVYFANVKCFPREGWQL